MKKFISFNMWKVKDFFINLLLTIRLFILTTLFSKKFKNIINEKERDGWTLTFNDEFDKGKIDRNKWITTSYYGARFHEGNIVNENKPPTMYMSDDCFEFTETTMKQMVIKKDVEVNYTDYDGKDWGNWTIPYQIGQIDSSKSFRQKYGYFEIRSKITSEPGSWPAFWLASTDSWPPEIDVYEIYTGFKKPFRNGMKLFNSNFHWGTHKQKNQKQSPMSHRVKNVSEDFHVYAVEWNEKCFKIYYDNILVRIFSNPEALNFFKYPMHIIINNAIHVGQNADKANYPTYHEVDYVRAYKKIDR